MFLNNGFNPDLSGVNQAGKERAVGWGTNTYAPKGNYAPTPTTSTGVGQWTIVEFSRTGSLTNLLYTATLPAGGTWAYYMQGLPYGGGSNEKYQAGVGGIAAGGTVVLSVRNVDALLYMKLLCYRIA